MLRTVMLLNADWLFCPGDKPSYSRPKCSEKGFKAVCLPHPNVELPHHNFDDAQYQFVSWYRKRFALPAALKGCRIFLDFDGVMMAATVYVNGRKAGEHRGGYVPFSVDATEHVRFGQGTANVLAVRVDSRELPDVPPCGGLMDYLTFGGIYREVRLRAVPPLHIEDVFCRPADVLMPLKRLCLSVAVANASEERCSFSVAAELLKERGGRPVGTARPAVAELPPGERRAVELAMEGLRDIKLWDLDSPTLYAVRVRLLAGRTVADEVCVRTGFREARFTPEGPFMLNGREVKLRGLNRHQTFPYIGGAAPARLQRRDADILRHFLGLNIVRTSHYPQSPHFLDRCDEVGLLVFEEIPGWQHIGDAAWKELAIRDLRQMILRDRNHPCVVLWGVRINESRDDHEFYAETNRLAHELDPTRQTGGVRCFEGSELLEDVYTMNDFIHDGGPRVLRDPRQVTRLDHGVPYLVTEFCGHMYPAKPWDPEERLVEHALRHVRVQDAAAGNERIAGAIGWCAFDYNTHRSFGAGDRICYHGVCDIFRFPKFAAYFYESQLDPSVRPVLRVASRWKLGERSGGGVEPLVVFSNCDQVEIYVGDEQRGIFRPAREQFPHLPHPPFICTGIGGWGHRWDDLRAVGYIDGKPAAEHRIACDGVPQKLVLWADDAELVADGADMTRIGFMVADQYGNPLPYANCSVAVSITGPGTLVGENPFCLCGGCGAVYLRAGRKPGRVTVTAAASGLAPQSVGMHVRPARDPLRRH